MPADLNQEISPAKAALIAGLAILVMALTVPIVEFYIFPALIDYKNAAQTAQNITRHTRLFSTAIFIHFITVICDLLATWALYIFLKPVNKYLALLAAWFRLVYAAFNIAALHNLIQLLASIKTGENFDPVQQEYLNDTILFHLHSFNLQWRFGLVFFGIYLCFLGYLVFRAWYIPKLVALCLLVAGAGYITDDLKFFFYPGFDTGFLWFTYLGELVFMFWLLIKGSRVKIEGRHL